jgi:SH3-like domain-containing protein
MTNTTLRTLWVITAMAALGLAAATINLMRLSRQGEFSRGSVVQVMSEDNLVLLRDEPEEAANFSAILENGASVTILDIDTSGEQPWYRVEAEEGSGWILESNIAADTE